MVRSFWRSSVVVSCAVLGVVCGVAPMSARAGDLNPPPGAIESTMKRLDQVEARTPINLNTAPSTASAVHTISQPGNYYLTGDIQGVQGKHGIQISLGGLPPGPHSVSIDLNGFSIVGVPGSLDGVHFTATFTDGRYVLRAGVPLAGITGFGGDGVHLANVDTVHVDGVFISHCDGTGLRLNQMKSAVIQNVRITDCDGDGLEVTVPQAPGNYQCIVRASSFSNCGGRGATIDTFTPGILSDCDVVIEDSLFTGNGTEGLACKGGGGGGGGKSTPLLARTVASSNGGSGFALARCGKATPALARACSSSDNGGEGFDLMDGSYVFEDCVASSNVGAGARFREITGLESSIEIIEYRALDNGTHGVDFEDSDVTLKQCSLNDNTGDGARIVRGSLSVSGGVCRGNGGSGVTADSVAGTITMSGLVCADNSGHGMECLDSTGVAGGSISIRECTFSGNTLTGASISGTSGGLLTDCAAFANGQVGFHLLALGHVLKNNSAGGNPGGNYVVALPGNAVGPSVTEANIMTDDRPAANYEP